MKNKKLSERTLIPSEGALLGETRFEDWLRRAANPQPIAVATASKA